MQVSQKAPYTYVTLLANVGGQLGLWIGASILSLIQMLFFLIRCFYLSRAVKVSTPFAVSH